MKMEEIYNFLNMAKPVTIPTGLESSLDDVEQHGHNATCDYTRCVGDEVKVGWFLGEMQLKFFA